MTPNPIRSLFVAMLLVPTVGLAQLPGQSVIDETDRRMHDYFDDQGCLRGIGCTSRSENGQAQHHGSLYVSPDGRRYGVGWDFARAQDADRTAREGCGSDCLEAITTTDQCLTVVTADRQGGPQIYFAVSPFGIEARILAKAACRASGNSACLTEVQQCTGRTFLPPPDSVAAPALPAPADDDVAYLLNPATVTGDNDIQGIRSAIRCMQAGEPGCLLFLVARMARQFHRFDDFIPALKAEGLHRPAQLLGNWEERHGHEYPGLAALGHAVYDLHSSYWRDLRCDLVDAYERLARVDPGRCKGPQCRSVIRHTLEGVEGFIYDRCLKTDAVGRRDEQHVTVVELKLPGLTIPPPRNVSHEAFLLGEQKRRKGREAYAAGRLVNAEQLFSEAILADSNFGDMFGERCVVRKELGKFEQALHDCSIALAKDPNDSESRIQLADTLGKMGRHREAARQMDRFFPLKATARRHLLRGWHHIKAGHFEQGLWDYHQTIRLEPDNINAYATRALAYYKLGETQAAKADLATAEALAPGKVSADVLWERFRNGAF